MLSLILITLAAAAAAQECPGDLGIPDADSKTCPTGMTSCSPASQVNECGENHVCLPLCCVLCDPCQYCYACEQDQCEAAGLDLIIGGERCPTSRRLGARLPLFGHSYEEPDACPPIPDGCPRDVQSVDDDTCEEVEDAPPCREMTGEGWCVDVGNACYGGADAGIRTSCFADNGVDAVYDVNGIAPAATGCCHPVD